MSRVVKIRKRATCSFLFCKTKDSKDLTIKSQSPFGSSQPSHALNLTFAQLALFQA